MTKFPSIKRVQSTALQCARADRGRRGEVGAMLHPADHNTMSFFLQPQHREFPSTTTYLVMDSPTTMPIRECLLRLVALTWDDFSEWYWEAAQDYEVYARQWMMLRHPPAVEWGLSEYCASFFSDEANKMGSPRHPSSPPPTREQSIHEHPHEAQKALHRVDPPAT